MATVAELTTELAAYRAARDAILDGAQSYSINGRSLARADLATIIKKIDDLESRIATLNRSGGRVSSPLFPSLRG